MTREFVREGLHHFFPDCRFVDLDPIRDGHILFFVLFASAWAKEGPSKIRLHCQRVVFSALSAVTADEGRRVRNADDGVDVAVDLVEFHVVEMRKVGEVALRWGDVGGNCREVVDDGVFHFAAIASII